MATVIDLLRHLGQHAAPDGDNALAGPVTLPGVTDSPLALPLPRELITAWTRLTDRPTLGHHALALSAAQTQHSVALMGHGSSPHDDLLLLLLSQLRRQPAPAMLYITPQNETLLRARLVQLAETLGIRWRDAAQPGGRITPAQLILATPTDLHRRVLRYHDRAWRWLWPQTRFIALPKLHEYTGAEAGHLHWLLRRVERLTSHPPLQILSSLASVADVGATLGRLFDRPMQVVAAPDGPSHSTLIALWRCDSDRAGAVLKLAEQLTARRLAITMLGRDADETARLRALAADKGIAQPEEARVAIVAGIPRVIDDRQSLLRSGYRLLILVAGDEPHELLFAAQPELLLNALPYWPLATSNPYVVAAQLSCAAAERPLEEAEIDRWSVRELRDRMIKKGTLQPLPSGDLWQIDPDVDDPYVEVDPRTIGGAPITVLSLAGEPIATIPPALQDRCTLPDQVFVPGLRIAGRDESSQTVQLAPDSVERATLVLAEITVNVREELAARTVRFGKQTTDLLKGKVWATQRIAGLRELRPDTAERRLTAHAPETQWLAAACWIPLSTPVPDPQTIGWAITQALPLIALASSAALAPAYDAAHQRLYLIETEPGGVGVVDGIYSQFERLIELALQVAKACAARPLYRRLAAAELTWLSRLYDPAMQIDLDQTAPVVAEPAPQPVSVPAKLQTPAPATVQPPNVRTPTPVEQPKPQPPSVRVPVPVEQPKPQPPAVRIATPTEPIKAPEARPTVADHAPAPRLTPPVPTPRPSPRPAAAAQLHPGNTIDRERQAAAPAPKRDSVPDGSQDRLLQPAPRVPLNVPEPKPTQPTAPKVPVESAGTRPPAANQQPPLRATPRQAAIYTAPETPAPVITSRSDQPGRTAEVPAEPQPTATAPDDAQQAVVEHTASSMPPADRPLEAPPLSVPRRRPGTGQYRIEDLLPPLDEEEDIEPAPPAREQPMQPMQPSSREQQGAALRNGRSEPIDDLAAPPEPPRPAPREKTEATPRSPVAERGPSRPQPEPPGHPARPDRQRSEPQRPFSNRSPGRQHPSNAPAPKRSQQRPGQRPYQPREPQKPPPPNDAGQRQAPTGYRRDRDEIPARTRPSSQPGPQDTPKPPLNRAEPPAPPPEPEPEADVHAMIERMRRLRQEREAAQRPTAPRPSESAPAEPIELRFHIGERVQCLPYGIGTVRASRILGGREQVMIDFPEYGAIEVDPALNLIRRLGSEANAEQHDEE